MTKTVKVKTNSKVVQFSAQSDIYGKISLMLQSRKVDLKDVFCCPLGPVPWALATSNGKVMKTSKPKLIVRLKKVSLLLSMFPYLLFPYSTEWS